MDGVKSKPGLTKFICRRRPLKAKVVSKLLVLISKREMVQRAFFKTYRHLKMQSGT